MYTQFAAILVFVLVVSGCTPIMPPTPEASTPPAGAEQGESEQVPTPTPVAQSPVDTGELDLSPEAENVATVVRQTLMEQFQVNADAIEVVEVEAVEWTDGCLGLGGPAELCLQAIIPGYRVTLAVDGQTYVYRTDADANAIRLEEGPAP